jgi:hypothetical protein
MLGRSHRQEIRRCIKRYGPPHIPDVQRLIGNEEGDLTDIEESSGHTPQSEADRPICRLTNLPEQYNQCCNAHE